MELSVLISLLPLILTILWSIYVVSLRVDKLLALSEDLNPERIVPEGEELRMPTGPYVEKLLSEKCDGCGGTKAPRKSHCSKCYFKLPPEMRAALYRRVGEGYEAAFDRSLAYLKGEALPK